MAKLSRRTGSIDTSGIRKVFDLAARLTNPVNFSIGQPDFDVPDVVKDAAVAAMREGFNRYTVTQGIPELRDAVRENLVDRARTASSKALQSILVARWLRAPSDGLNSERVPTVSD